MLARDLGAKGGVSRMVYSGDINKEKSCSVGCGHVDFSREKMSLGYLECDESPAK